MIDSSGGRTCPDRWDRQAVRQSAERRDGRDGDEECNAGRKANQMTRAMIPAGLGGRLVGDIGSRRGGFSYKEYSGWFASRGKDATPRRMGCARSGVPCYDDVTTRPMGPLSAVRRGRTAAGGRRFASSRASSSGAAISQRRRADWRASARSAISRSPVARPRPPAPRTPSTACTRPRMLRRERRRAGRVRAVAVDSRRDLDDRVVRQAGQGAVVPRRRRSGRRRGRRGATRSAAPPPRCRTRRRGRSSSSGFSSRFGSRYMLEQVAPRSSMTSSRPGPWPSRCSARTVSNR